MVDQLPPARPVKPALSPASVLLRLAGIGAVVAAVAGTFFYVNGSLDAQRLRPKTLVNALEHNNGVHPGYRRNHAKGMCVIGYFESNGNAQSLSRAPVFQTGRTPVVVDLPCLAATLTRLTAACRFAVWRCVSLRPMANNGGPG